LEYAIIGFFVLCIVALFAALKIVPQTDNILIERLGKYHRTLAAGVHIIMPFIERVAHVESILERQLPAKDVPAFTKDNVQITITLAILYRVTVPRRPGIVSKTLIRPSRPSSSASSAARSALLIWTKSNRTDPRFPRLSRAIFNTLPTSGAFTLLALRL
jgi:regulator of protease activity HflC (stomatin/prohibitin superfamily)